MIYIINGLSGAGKSKITANKQKDNCIEIFTSNDVYDKNISLYEQQRNFMEMQYNKLLSVKQYKEQNPHNDIIVIGTLSFYYHLYISPHDNENSESLKYYELLRDIRMCIIFEFCLLCSLDRVFEILLKPPIDVLFENTCKKNGNNRACFSFDILNNFRKRENKYKPSFNYTTIFEQMESIDLNTMNLENKHTSHMVKLCPYYIPSRRDNIRLCDDKISKKFLNLYLLGNRKIWLKMGIIEIVRSVAHMLPWALITDNSKLTQLANIRLSELLGTRLLYCNPRELQKHIDELQIPYVLHNNHKYHIFVLNGDAGEFMERRYPLDIWQNCGNFTVIMLKLNNTNDSPKIFYTMHENATNNQNGHFSFRCFLIFFANATKKITLNPIEKLH